MACVLCGGKPHSNIALCEACTEDLPWITHACMRCALPLPKDALIDQLCGNCLQHDLPFHRTIALFDYQTPIDRLITGLKFHDRLVYAKLLGELLAQCLIKRYQHQTWPTCIIPMPLHKKRLRERGFNQSVEIARPLVKAFAIPLDRKSCSRVRATVAQTSLPATERRQNIKNAFVVDAAFTAKHVAILDDVVTTGSTITELSWMLKNVGVEQIDVWCCARTSG